MRELVKQSARSELEEMRARIEEKRAFRERCRRRVTLALVEEAIEEKVYGVLIQWGNGDHDSRAAAKKFAGQRKEADHAEG